MTNTKCLWVILNISIHQLDLHSKNNKFIINYFSEIAQQKSHSGKFPQNATKSIMLFVPVEIGEENYFDNGFTWVKTTLSILHCWYTNDYIQQLFVGS